MITVEAITPKKLMMPVRMATWHKLGSFIRASALLASGVTACVKANIKIQQTSHTATNIPTKLHEMLMSVPFVSEVKLLINYSISIMISQ